MTSQIANVIGQLAIEQLAELLVKQHPDLFVDKKMTTKKLVAIINSADGASKPSKKPVEDDSEAADDASDEKSDTGDDVPEGWTLDEWNKFVKQLEELEDGKYLNVDTCKANAKSSKLTLNEAHRLCVKKGDEEKLEAVVSWLEKQDGGDDEDADDESEAPVKKSKAASQAKDDEDSDDDEADDEADGDADDDDDGDADDDEADEESEKPKGKKTAKKEVKGGALDLSDTPKLPVKDRPKTFPKGMKFVKGTNYIVVNGVIIGAVSKKGFGKLTKSHTKPLTDKGMKFKEWTDAEINKHFKL